MSKDFYQKRRCPFPIGKLACEGKATLAAQHLLVVPTHPFVTKPKSEYGYFGSAMTLRNYSTVTAAAMLTSNQADEEVGGFDTDFASDCNDMDYRLKLSRRNYRVAWTPDDHLTHHEGVSIQLNAPNPAQAQLLRDR